MINVQKEMKQLRNPNLIIPSKEGAMHADRIMRPPNPFRSNPEQRGVLAPFPFRFDI
jgi:hypothetical protein